MAGDSPKIAGSAILYNLSKRLFDDGNSLVSRIEATGRDIDIKKELKDIVVTEFTSGSWRTSLGSSMKLANKMLDNVVKGLESVHGGSDSGLILDIHMMLDVKGLVGTGSGLLKSMVEVGLEVDWILGLPYYPGSTLKGATRAILEDARTMLGNTERQDTRDLAAILFGSSGSNGHMSYAIFSDAYPVGCYSGSRHPCLVYTGDVVTPHYFRPGSGIVEREYEAQPTPVVHVAIAPGTVFRVVAAVRKPRDDELRYLLGKGRDLGFLRDHEASGLYGLGLFVARLLGAAMMTGFAARSGKGYNVFVPLSEDEIKKPQFEVVSLGIRRGRPRESRSSTRGSSRHHGQSSYDRRRHGGHGYGRGGRRR